MKDIERRFTIDVYNGGRWLKYDENMGRFMLNTSGDDWVVDARFVTISPAARPPARRSRVAWSKRKHKRKRARRRA